MCRGFRVIAQPSGMSRTIVLLPAAQKAGLWTVDEPAGKPRSALSGSHGLASSFSARQNEILP